MVLGPSNVSLAYGEYRHGACLSPAQARKLEKQVERLQARVGLLRDTITQLKAENLEGEKLKVKKACREAKWEGGGWRVEGGGGGG